jgi:hypothetical protein
VCNASSANATGGGCGRGRARKASTRARRAIPAGLATHLLAIEVGHHAGRYLSIEVRGYQRRQSCDEVERIEDDEVRAVLESMGDSTVGALLEAIELRSIWTVERSVRVHVHAAVLGEQHRRGPSGAQRRAMRARRSVAISSATTRTRRS